MASIPCSNGLAQSLNGVHRRRSVGLRRRDLRSLGGVGHAGRAGTRKAKRQISINQSHSFSIGCVLVESSSAVVEVSNPKQAHRLWWARSSCSCGSHATRSEGNAAAKGVTRNGFAARRRKDEKDEADGAASRATIVRIQLRCVEVYGRLVLCCKPGCGSCAA